MSDRRNVPRAVGPALRRRAFLARGHRDLPNLEPPAEQSEREESYQGGKPAPGQRQSAQAHEKSHGTGGVVLDHGQTPSVLSAFRPKVVEEGRSSVKRLNWPGSLAFARTAGNQLDDFVSRRLGPPTSGALAVLAWLRPVFPTGRPNGFLFLRPSQPKCGFLIKHRSPSWLWALHVPFRLRRKNRQRPGQ